MKAQVQKILLTLFFVCAAYVSALAQDAGMSDGEILETHGVEAEGIGLSPGAEVPSIPRATRVVPMKDSIALQMHDFPMQRAAQKPAEKTSEKQNGKTKDDSILTFNFLYYIIQKYKLQDIID